MALYRIKTWRQMEEQYGLSDSGSIDIHPRFTKQMERELPDDRVIEVCGHKWKYYTIGPEMIEDRISNVSSSVMLNMIYDYPDGEQRFLDLFTEITGLVPVFDYLSNTYSLKGDRNEMQ